MATLPDVMSALVQQVITATANIIVNSQTINVEVGEGWPNLDGRQDVARGGSAVVGVYHKMTSYSKPNFPHIRVYTDSPIGIKSMVSSLTIHPGQTATITLSYASGSSQVNLSDAISACIQNGILRDAGIGIALSSETLTSLATKLAAFINGQSPINTWVSASAAGAVVTLTNNSSAVLLLSSYVGNTRSVTRDVQKAHRSVQIIVWSGDKDVRDAVGIAITNLVATLEDQYGYQTSSGELIRLLNQGERPDDQNMQSDIYRIDYQLMLEHSVDASDEAWAVLAPIGNMQQF
jgi:hypothetical protein